jgi:hypothetical protein
MVSNTTMFCARAQLIAASGAVVPAAALRELDGVPVGVERRHRALPRLVVRPSLPP